MVRRKGGGCFAYFGFAPEGRASKRKHAFLVTAPDWGKQVESARLYKATLGLNAAPCGASNYSGPNLLSTCCEVLSRVNKLFWGRLGGTALKTRLVRDRLRVWHRHRCRSGIAVA